MPRTPDYFVFIDLKIKHRHFVFKEQFSVYKPGISPVTNSTDARNMQAMRVLKNKHKNHSSQI